MRKGEGRERTARVGRQVPNEVCPTCGTVMKKHRGSWRTRVNGETITVPEINTLKCPKCGERLISYHEVGRVEDYANAHYRETYGLLTPDEIRAIRKHYDLTQAELARLLRLGGNTISRWEAGRNVQTGAMDILLRLIRDLPGSLAWLKKNAA